MLRALRFLVALWFSLALTATPVEAASPGRLLVTGGGAPSWVLPPARNGVDLNFANGLYWTKGATGPLASGRATNETCFTSTGNLVQVGPYQNCVTDLGVEAQPGATNSLLNNTMSGAVVGTPGTYPTGWGVEGGCSGLAINVASVGVTNGAPSIDLRVVGTTSTNYCVYMFVSLLVTSASYGQTWCESLSGALVAGSLTNVSSILTDIRPSVGATGDAAMVLTSTLTRQPVACVTPSVSSVGLVNAAIALNYSIGVAIDATIRIAAPQLELNAIPASVASATVATGGTCTPGSNISWTIPTVNGGTAATVTGTVTGTTLSGALTVTGAGSYTVDATHGLPASPVTVTGGTCTTQPTINIVPTNNAAMGSATTPILTTNGALARSPDSITMPVVNCAGPVSEYVVGVPASPSASPSNQFAVELSDGGLSNRTDLFRSGTSGTATMFVRNATQGVIGSISSVAALPANASSKMSGLSNSSVTQVMFSGALAFGNNISTNLPLLNKLTIGARADGLLAWNGTISRVAVACGRSLLNQ